ncbi:MAG: hypothetical protein ACRCSO_13255 [Sphingomonas sp.]
MTARGRPLRFLVAVMAGWICFRAVMLWPITPVMATDRLMAASASPPLSAVERAIPAPVVVAIRPTGPHAGARLARLPTHPPLMAVAPAKLAALAQREAVPLAAADTAALAPMPLVAPPPTDPPKPSPAPPLDVVPLAAPGLATGIEPEQPRRPSRWRGSLWLLARAGDASRADLASGTLGGGQAGLRLGYLVEPKARVMIYGRVSSALGQRQSEAALGVDWQPTKLPIHLIAEQRIALDHSRGGPTVGAIAGIGPVTIASHFRLEAYGQAGVIARDGGVGFADGAARIDHAVAHIGGARVSLGGGAWGAAQPDAQRLDVGPSINVDIAVKERPLRLSLDWRERVAGSARPTSGLAITLGTNF